MRIEYGVNPNCSEIVIRFPTCKEDGYLSVGEIRKRLKQIGIFEVTVNGFWGFEERTPEENALRMLVDIDNPTSPDFEHGSHVCLETWCDARELDESLGSGDRCIVIVAHQHCQVQLYPTIEKICNEFGLDAVGYDGGGSFEEDYGDWIAKGREVSRFNSQKFTRKRNRFVKKVLAAKDIL